jgi:TPR repeat protein
MLKLFVFFTFLISSTHASKKSFLEENNQISEPNLALSLHHNNLVIITDLQKEEQLKKKNPKKLSSIATSTFQEKKSLPLIDFNVLTQLSQFRGEEFLDIKEKLESSSVSPKFLVKYLKLWPSVHTFPQNGDLESFKSELLRFFYEKCEPAFNGNKFTEAKVCLSLAHSIRTYEESLFSNFKNRSQRALKSLLLENNYLKETTSSNTLYWAWKHRQDFSSLGNNDFWLKVIHLAGSPSTLSPSSKAQYMLGRLYEKGEEGLDKNSEEAQRWYRQAAKNNYNKAQFYLEYLMIDKDNSANLLGFYKKLAEEGYPYAQFVVGEENWLHQKSEINFENKETQQGFLYLLRAARQGISEAQERLDIIHDQEREEFYKLCYLSDSCASAEDLRKFLGQKASLNLPSYAYQLARMYEDGRGIPFNTAQEWFQAFTQAKQGYELATLYKFSGAERGIQRIQQKRESVEKAKGFILNKIRKGVTVSFSPDHPLFKEFSKVLNVLYKYSPGAKYLGACLIQQLLEAHQSTHEKEKIVQDLLLTVKSPEFKEQLKDTVKYRLKTKEKKQLGEKEKEAQKGEKPAWEEIDTRTEEEILRDEETEATEAAKLFTYMVEKLQPSAEKISSSHSTGLADFLKANQSFIFRKIEKGIEGVTAEALPHHPLFTKFCSFIDLISRYSGSVPEHGAHLIQQILHFPPQSLQAEIIIDSLLDVINSKKFQEGEEDDTQQDKDDYRVEKLAKLNKAIELTRTPCKLFSASKKEEEGGVPEKLKVSQVMFRDPRIQVFNFSFDQEEKHPFDRQTFDDSVKSILKLFEDLNHEGKISREILYDSEKKEHGNHKTLSNLLTNGEKFGHLINNRFGHRMIKIGQILQEGNLEEGILADLLGSWAAAGLHCTTRSEGETHKFYNLYVTEGQSQESETATLEVKVALALADLRRQLLHNFVPEDETERLHQIAYLEKKHGKKLGLVDPQGFEDPHEKIVQERYKNLKIKLIKDIILNGDVTGKVNIESGQGYNNPQILIDHLVKVVNESQPLIPMKVLQERFEKYYEEALFPQYMSSYYNGDLAELLPEEIKMTSEGARALLYSLGYLEKDLGIKNKK